MNERAELAKEKRRKKFKNDGKKKKTAAEAAAVTPFMSPRDAVLALLEAMQAPQHVAVLSLAYKKKTGRAIKDDHRHGGMLNFIRTELKDEVLLVGNKDGSVAPSGLVQLLTLSLAVQDGAGAAVKAAALYRERER